MARYSENGSVIYLGRADTQVKIRGPRLELKEVELQVSASLPMVQQVVAEAVVPAGDEAKALLAAFVVVPVQEECESAAAEMADFTVPPEAEELLAERLPSYMVPAVWIRVPMLPQTVSGKTDRKRLREMGASYWTSELARLQSASKANNSKKTPATEASRQLAGLWAGVLGLEAEEISPDDNFFRLGGDSVDAMKLVADSRKVGLRLCVAQIFKQPKLEDLAGQLDPSAEVEAEESEIAPFSLLTKLSDQEQCRRQASVLCGTTNDAIEDMYPCTPMQEGFVAQTIKTPGDYVLQSVMEIADTTDLSRFRRS